MTRTSDELQRDVAILIKQNDDLKVFARELAKQWTNFATKPRN